MEVVSEGSLESISRPASSSKRSSSRSSVRSISQLQGSLDILPPEVNILDPSSWAKPEIEDDVVVTDFTDDFNQDEEAQSSVSTNTETPLEFNVQTVSDKSKVVSDGVLAVRVENEANEANIEQESSETSCTGDNQDSDDVDPKIRKGLEKIKKLDTILLEKTKKEKEVKKQRLEQERMWREHIESLERARDAQLGKQVDLGPAHFLALGAPEDTDDSLYEESPPVTPLFATQPIVDEVLLERRNLQQKSENSTERQETTSVDSKGCSRNPSEPSNESCQDGEKNEQHSQGSSRRNNRDKKDRKTKKKDFIKRNIMLAADANNVIAMTEEEKKRLDELLSDMTNLVDESFAADSDALTLFGDGFQPSQEEAKQLADIDFHLQSLLPSEEYDALCSTTINEQEMSFQVRTPRSETSNDLLDEENQTYGELVLHETKEMRDMKQRLLAIEEQLDRFQNLDHNEGVLSESLLRQLLDGDSRTTSEATTIFDRVSSVSTSMSYDTTSSFERSSFALESQAPSPAISTAEH